MEARKRRRTASEVGGGRVGEGEGPVASTSAPLDSIAPLFADLRALCEERAKDAGPGVGGTSVEIFERRVEGAREGLMRCLKGALGDLDAARADGRHEEAGRIESDLSKVFGFLEKAVTKVGDELDVLSLAQREFMAGGAETAEGWRDLVSFARRLSYTTFAPANYVPGDPRWGVVGPFLQPVGSSTGFWHFSPPAPQKWHMDASVLYDDAIQSGKGAADTAAEAEKAAGDKGATTMDVDTSAEAEGRGQENGKEEEEARVAAGDAEGVGVSGAAGSGEKVPQEAPEGETKREAYNPVLSHMVDFVLNPDLEVANHVDFPSEDEASESSD